MSWSLKYNNIDLSAYGLRITANSPALAALFSADQTQLPDRAHVARSVMLPKDLEFDIIVQASSTALLKSRLDSIKRICAQLEAGQLILDALDDRYWMARFQRLDGQMISPYAFRGSLLFSADDPLAYNVNITTSGPHTIDGAIVTFEVAVGGTAFAKPIYTLTAGEDLPTITLKVENTDTDEELQWQGSLTNGQALTIDSALWIVKKAGTVSMATVSGQFPRLIPGDDNHIKVTGFFVAVGGTLNIAYRNAYL